MIICRMFFLQLNTAALARPFNSRLPTVLIKTSLNTQRYKQ